MLDHGHYAQEFVTAFEQSRTYKIQFMTQAAADAQMQAGKLVTEVTIPPDFDQAVAGHQPMTVPVVFDNLNKDLWDDGTRGMRLALASFYAKAAPGQVPVTVDEHDEYPGDTGYIPFLALSVVVITVMVAGLLQAGNATAREYEQNTIKGLLLAPVRPWQILAGRMLGAYLMSLPALAVVLAVVVFAVGDDPVRLWLALAVALLTLAVFVPAGVLLGTVTRDRQLVAIFTRGLPAPLFFLSGVFAPLSFQTRAVQDIGQLMPVHWAIVLGLERTAATRVEKGERALTAAGLTAWLARCGVDGLAAAAVRAVWEESRRSSGDEPVKAWFSGWVESEREAHMLRYWSPLLVPGIVQTPDYAYEVFCACGQSHDQATAAAAARMERQGLLDRADPPMVVVVMWEPVLDHQVGTPAVMLGQLTRLLEVADRQNVMMHVVPSAHGANAGLGGPLSLASAGGKPDVLLASSLLEDMVTSDVTQARTASTTFEGVRGVSANIMDTRRIIAEAITKWESR